MASTIWTDWPPKVAGWYWWWSGNSGDAVLPVSVFYSGTNAKCFVAAGQLGLKHFAELDQFAGWWSVQPIAIPEAPITQAEAALKAAKKPEGVA